MAGRRAWLSSPGLVAAGLGLLVVLGLIAFSPEAPVSDRAQVEAFHARIVRLLGDHRTDPANPGGGFLPDVRVELLDGPQAGEQQDAYLQAPGESQVIADYRVGDEVVLTRTVMPDGPPFVAVADRWRLPQLAFLVGILVLAAVATAGWRGLRAILSLVLTVAVVIRILIPGVLAGLPPVPLAIGLSLVLAVVAIAWTEGLTRASVAAILGTATALGLTAILGAAGVALAGFTNAAGTDLVYFQTANGSGLDLRGLLLAAFVIGALGLLIDVTVTQSAAVAELHDQAGLSGRTLFASGSAIGRSHIGASINTLFLAYAGAAMPALLVLAGSAQPLVLVLNSETTASELVRTIVGSVGLLLAVPATTAIATLLLGRPVSEAVGSTSIAPRKAWLPRAFGIVGGAVAILAVALIAGSMISTPAHPPAAVPDLLVPASTDSGTEPPAAGASPGDTSPSVEPTGPTTPVFDVGQIVSLAELGGGPVSITVLVVHDTAGGGGARRIDVELEYRSTAALDVAPADWRLLTDQGNEYEGTPDRSHDRPLVATTLTPNQSLTGWLTFSALATDQYGFLEFLSSSGEPFFLVSVF
jgi:uncharacterized membrane protein